MKIKGLKQPYKSMALFEQNRQEGKSNEYACLLHAFAWHKTSFSFWCSVDEGESPEITPRIKSMFPSEIFKSNIMKIKELKEPYKSMALHEQERQHSLSNEEDDLKDAFLWCRTSSHFWGRVHDEGYPEITPKIKAMFPPEIFKPKLEVGKKYKPISWNNEKWVKILYIGEKNLFTVTKSGSEISLSLKTIFVPYEEEKKELLGFEPFYVLFSENNLEEVYAKNKEEVIKRVKLVEGSYINIFTKEEAKKAGLK